MTGSTTVTRIEIPSADPVFLTVVGIHILLGVTCVIAGAVAMLSTKRQGRHSSFGTVYYWGLLVLFGSATFLSAMRWAEDYHLFVLGALSFGSAWFGRTAVRQRWHAQFRVHLTGMAFSYILLLVAFYVDNGKQLPVWRDLPTFTYWLLPFAVGAPIAVWALFRHPLITNESKVSRPVRRKAAKLSQGMPTGDDPRS